MYVDFVHHSVSCPPLASRTLFCRPEFSYAPPPRLVFYVWAFVNVFETSGRTGKYRKAICRNKRRVKQRELPGPRALRPRDRPRKVTQSSSSQTSRKTLAPFPFNSGRLKSSFYSDRTTFSGAVCLKSEKVIALMLMWPSFMACNRCLTLSWPHFLL